jgi:NhaP-type Na+/H+ or K+/H+ antiporter
MSFNVALAVIGGLTLLMGLSAGFTRSKLSVISEPMVATGVGVLVGPLGLGLLDLARWGEPTIILEQIARVTVALSVMGIALRLPRGYFRSHWHTLSALLTLGMLVMWGVSGLLAWALLGGVSFWGAMLIGAVVTPTDPVLSGTIVTGEEARQNISARLRHLISAESGANDGGAYPFVLLGILMLTEPAAAAWQTWAVDVLLWEVGGAVAAGLAIGYAAGRLQRWSADRDDLEETSLLTITVALSLTVLGATKLMGTDGILAVFAAGLAFHLATSEKRTERETHVQEVLKRVFTFPIFVFFGMALPWHEWMALGWAGGVLAALILLLRRLPTMLALRPLLGPLRSHVDTVFAGWFGPIGMAALFYATLAERKAGLEEAWVVGSLVVFASTVAHGMTATPLTKWYGRKEGTAENEGRGAEGASR